MRGTALGQIQIAYSLVAVELRATPAWNAFEAAHWSRRVEEESMLQAATSDQDRNSALLGFPPTRNLVKVSGWDAFGVSSGIWTF